MTDIVELLRSTSPDDYDRCCEVMDEAAVEIERLRQVLENTQQARVLQGKAITDASNEIERLRSMVTPKPLDDKAPKDRVLIGVERPPYEDKTYYDIIHWREDHQEWMVEAGCDWNISPAPRLWAHWSASHYLDPLDLPGLPYWDPADDEDEGDEDMAQGET